MRSTRHRYLRPEFISIATLLIVGALMLSVLTLFQQRGAFHITLRVIAMGGSQVLCFVVVGSLCNWLGRSSASGFRALRNGAIVSALLLPAPYEFMYASAWITNDWGDWGPTDPGLLLVLWTLPLISIIVGVITTAASRWIGWWAGTATIVLFSLLLLGGLVLSWDA